MRRFAAAIVKSLITTVIFFGAAEVALRGAYAVRNSMVNRVPLPYALGDQYGPVPPWLDRMMILVPDATLIWRSLPNVHRTYVDIFSPARRAEDRTALLRRFSPVLPPEFRNNPTWTIDLNTQGYRYAEVPAAKPPSTVRIACIGDSWTFGMNVDQDRSYPARLDARLRESSPDTRYEVLNFGVLGYSSFQGLQLLRTRALAMHPDIVAIGFGMNDSGVSGYRDKDMVSEAPPPTRLAARVADAARELELYKLLHYAAQVSRFHPKPIGEYLKAEATKGSDAVDYAAMEPWTRVSPKDYEQNLRDMIGLVRAQGGRVVLLDNELWDESPYRPVLRRIAADAAVPLIDTYRILTDARAQMEHDIERRLGLRPSADTAAGVAAPAGTATTVIFRVFHGVSDVPRALSITGSDAQLGAFQPNTVLMRDDGADGDERAGDGVWSYRITAPAGSRLLYVYTNSGARGQWEGLDVPHIREVVIPASPDGGPVYLPIETFGRVYMQADDWHTDAAGYDLIAAAVASAIERSQVSSFTSQAR